MEKIFIIGPQGSGKTTLAQLIAGKNSVRVLCDSINLGNMLISLYVNDDCDHDVVLDECPSGNFSYESILLSLPQDNHHTIIFCLQEKPIDVSDSLLNQLGVKVFNLAKQSES